MRSFYSVIGYYKPYLISSEIFICKTKEGLWYVAKGKYVVCLTNENLTDGVTIDQLKVIDSFTFPKPINSINELNIAIGMAVGY